MPQFRTFISGVVVGAVLVGYLTHYTPKEESKTQVEDITNSRIQDTVIKHQTKTVKTKDGTVTTVVTDTHAKTNEIVRSDDKLNVSKVTARPNYSLGISWLPSTNRGPQYTDSEVEAAARLGGSDLWLQTSWDFKYHQAKIGVRIDL